MKKNRKDISYDEAVSWRTKVTITEKAVATYIRKFLSEKDHDRIVPAVREIFDSAKAQEITIENIPEPPQDDDDIEKRLEELREFNKRLLDEKNAKAKAIEIRIRDEVEINEGKTKVKAVKTEDVTEGDKNDNAKGNDVEIVKEKGNDSFYVDEFLGKNLHWSNDSNSDDSDDSEVETDDEYDNDAKEYEKEICINESDENYKVEVEEFNKWYYKKLEERKGSKVDKTSRKLYDKIDSNSAEYENENDDLLYKQVLGREYEDEVVKRMDPSTIVPLLQVILVMLFITGKTLREQTMLIARMSKFSRPSLFNYLQSEGTPSSGSPCSCKTQSVCCEVTTALIAKVSSMVNKASTGVVWFEQFCGALYCAKLRTVRVLKIPLVTLGRVMLQLADEDN